MSIFTYPALSMRARVTGRSYWALRYTDGRIVLETDVDWSLAPPWDRQALRLHCPNGEVAELGNTGDASGRLFQFKGGLMSPDGRETIYHMIGIVDGADGWARCAVWDYRLRKLITFHDNVHKMSFENIGLLSFDVLGIKLG